MKKFHIPEVIVNEFSIEDVLTTSSLPPADPFPTIDPDEGVIV